MRIAMAMPALAPDERPPELEFEASGDLEVAESDAAVGFEEMSGVLLVREEGRLSEEGIDVEDLAASLRMLVASTLEDDAGRAAVVDRE